MAYDYSRHGYPGSVGDSSSIGGGVPSGVGYGNNERDRMQENLAKAFSLLDEPREPTYQHSPYYGDNRIGTAPSGAQNPYGIGGGLQKSNYTGSEFGDSQGDRSSQPPRSRFEGGSDQFGVPTLGIQQNSTFGAGGGGIETLNVGGSRRAQQRFIGGSQNSQRSGSENRSNIGGNTPMQGSGGNYAGVMATGAHNEPVFSQHMASRETNELNFMGSAAQASESNNRSSYGPAGMVNMGAGPQYGHLNKQNLGGLGGVDNRRSFGGMVNSEVGSLYRGERDEDAMSHFMGQSDFGGAPTDIGVQSMVAGQNNQFSNQGYGLNQPMSLKPPTNHQQPPRRRESVYKKDTSPSKADNSLSRENRLSSMQRQAGKDNKNYGSFLQGFAGDSKPPLKDQRRPISEYRKETNVDLKSTGLVRDRSSRGRGGDNDSTNMDAISIGSRRHHGDMSPSKHMGALSVEDGTTSYQNLQGTPQIGSQIFIQDMNTQIQDEASKQLQMDLMALRDRYRKIEGDWQKRLDDLKQQNLKDIEVLGEKHKQAEALLVEAKDEIRNSILDAIEKERTKMEQLHTTDLENKERQHTQNLQKQKVLLEAETRHLEDQLSHQSELKAVLDKLQQKTVDVSEIVQSNLKQRDEELKKREQELIKAEREMQEESDIDIAVEEKKLEEDERKLQRMKENALRQKQSQHEEVNRLREQRKKAQVEYDAQVQNQKNELQQMKEALALEQKNLEDLNAKRKNNQQINDLENQQKETEVDNMRKRLLAEKKEFEVEQRDRLLREIQVSQIEIEDKRKEIALHEGDLRKDYRMLEKKQELLKSDKEEMDRKKKELAEELLKFEEQKKNILQMGEKLNMERDKVMHEKAAYEAERERVMKLKADYEFQKSLMQSEYLKAEEMENELKQRQIMLNMLQFNKQQKDKDLSSLTFHQLGFGGTALPTGQKMHEVVASQNNLSYGRENAGQASSVHQRIKSTYSSPDQLKGHSVYGQANAIESEDRPRFNYNNYMHTLQRKLAEHQTGVHVVASASANHFYGPPRDILAGTPQGYNASGTNILSQKDQEEKNEQFRDRILQKLGNADDFDSKKNSEIDLNPGFAEGLEVPSDMEYGEELVGDGRQLIVDSEIQHISQK